MVSQWIGLTGRFSLVAHWPFRGAGGDVSVGVCARTRFVGGNFFFLAMVWCGIKILKKLKNFPRARAPEILRAVHPKVGI